MGYLVNVHSQKIASDIDGMPNYFLRFDLNKGSVGLHLSMGESLCDLALALRAAEKEVRASFSSADAADFDRLTKKAEATA